MSGGSLGYFYSKLGEYDNVLKDRELNDLVHDLVKVFHDREWADDADISEGEYNETVAKFKDKWFADAGKHERYLSYIDDAVRELKRELRLDTHYCKDCKHWEPQEGYTTYGNCEYHAHCLIHSYEYTIEECLKGELRLDGKRKSESVNNA